MTIAEYPKLRDRRPAPEDDEDLYPSSDGEPMGETVAHFLAAFQTVDILTRLFADQPDVLVARNTYIYYEENNPQACVAPDAYVMSGVTGPVPKSFFTWLNDGRTPDIVFEFASLTTWPNDSGSKKEIYQNDLRIGEYFQFDPIGECLKPRLQGFRLVRGQYVPIKAVDGRIRSEFLDLEVFAEGITLRFFDPKTGTVIPTSVERDQIAAADRSRADKEKARTDEEKLRADEEKARADDEKGLSDAARRLAAAEKKRADDEKRRADDEKERRIALEARLEALERQQKLS